MSLVAPFFDSSDSRLKKDPSKSKKVKGSIVRETNTNGVTNTKSYMVSWTPRIMAIEDFASQEELDFLLSYARNFTSWHKTSLVGINSYDKPNGTITSDIAPVHQEREISKITARGKKIIADVLYRISSIAAVPMEHMEK